MSRAMSILFQCAAVDEPKCSLHSACCSSADKSQRRTRSPLNASHFPYTPDRELSPDFYLMFFKSKPLDWMYQHHPLNLMIQNIPRIHQVTIAPAAAQSIPMFPNATAASGIPLRNINHSMSHLCSSHFPCSIRPYMKQHLRGAYTQKRVTYSSPSINPMPGNFSLTPGRHASLTFPLSSQLLLITLKCILSSFTYLLGEPKDKLYCLINQRIVIEISLSWCLEWN